MQANSDESNINFGTRDIFFKPQDKNIKILTQDFNGPCMLIAIVNALILQGKIHLDKTHYTLASIVHMLQGLNNKLPELDGLIYGCDINPIFTDCTKFKDYPEFLKMLNLKMVHSIVCDPVSPEFQEISKYDYDSFQIQLCQLDNDEKDNSMLKKNDFIKEWNNEVQKQTTKYGIKNIISSLQDEEVAIYFRANHFSVLVKDKGSVFCLLTDEGFNYTEYVWESIPNETGDSIFYDSFFNSLTEGSLENLIESVESLNQSKSLFHENNERKEEETKDKPIFEDSSDGTSSGDDELSKTNNLVDQQLSNQKIHEIEQARNAQGINPQSINAVNPFWTNMQSEDKPN